MRVVQVLFCAIDNRHTVYKGLLTMTTNIVQCTTPEATESDRQWNSLQNIPHFISKYSAYNCLHNSQPYSVSNKRIATTVEKRVSVLEVI